MDSCSDQRERLGRIALRQRDVVDDHERRRALERVDELAEALVVALPRASGPSGGRAARSSPALPTSNRRSTSLTLRLLRQRRQRRVGQARARPAESAGSTLSKKVASSWSARDLPDDELARGARPRARRPAATAPPPPRDRPRRPTSRRADRPTARRPRRWRPAPSSSGMTSARFSTEDALPERHQRRAPAAAHGRLPRRREVHGLERRQQQLPVSSVCSSAGRTLRERAGRFEVLDERVDVVHALRAMTLMVSTMPRSRSTRGRTDVMRTSSGSVVSKRLNSSVHENVRRSIRSLACRASAAAKSTCLRIDAGAQPRPPACAGRPRAPRRATPASPAACRCASSGRTRDDVERASPRATASATAIEPEVDDALVVERPRREVGPDHAGTSARPRSSRPTSGASVSSSAGAAAMRSVSVDRRARIDRLDRRRPGAPRGSRRSCVDVARRCRAAAARPPGSRARSRRPSADPRSTSPSGARGRRACRRPRPRGSGRRSGRAPRRIAIDA